MLTVVCPNCRHRFSTSGCCETNSTQKDNSLNDAAYYGGILVPKRYTSDDACVINRPTVLHRPALNQSNEQQRGSVTRTSESEVIDSPKLQRYDLDKQLMAVLSNEIQKSSNDLQSNTSNTGENRLSTYKDATRIKNADYQLPSKCHITTTCDLTGGIVTITTPNIQSDGYLIQNSDPDPGAPQQVPPVETLPKLSGGSCLVQKTFSTEDEGITAECVPTSEDMRTNNGGMKRTDSQSLNKVSSLDNSCSNIGQNCDHNPLMPPSGCQELPGTRYSSKIDSNKLMYEEDSDNSCYIACNGDSSFSSNKVSCCGSVPQVHDRICNKESQLLRGHRDNCCDPFPGQIFFPQSQNHPGKERRSNHCRNNGHDQCSSSTTNSFSTTLNNRESLLMDSTSGVQIHVNATVQLPASLGQCSVNITATRTNPVVSEGATKTRICNNFNGGGIVEVKSNDRPSKDLRNKSGRCSISKVNNSVIEKRNEAPSTPVSWLMPCMFGCNPYMLDKDRESLLEAKELLRTCGWYHEGLSWKQSENLLRNAPIGRWLMRDSSDSRYTFAISVQTTRGPTSVRVQYFFGRYRLDAEPRFILMTPLFDCPFEMLEYYVNYSKQLDEQRKEVWVDYSGQLYSQIYLTKPLVKEVRPLSHLARLAINRYNLPTKHLPPFIQNYLAEYRFRF